MTISYRSRRCFWERQGTSNLGEEEAEGNGDDEHQLAGLGKRGHDHARAAWQRG